jgi:hypothetical protein
VAGLALIAFAFQSYVTQTHIHLRQPVSFSASDIGAPSEAKSLHGVAAGPQHTERDKAPANDEPVKCPLCQAVGYAGHFVTPAAAALLLPTAAISILPLATAILSSRDTPSHNWQSRGPPHS